MAKPKTQWVCSSCGKIEAKQWGQCPKCKEWNTFHEASTETAAPKGRIAPGASSVPAATLIDLGTVDELGAKHNPTGIAEFDRVLNGGLVDGSFTVLAAPPGAGKSTLATQLVARLRDNKMKIALVAGEETAAQIKLRFQRLGLSADGIFITAETSVERFGAAMRENNIDLVIVDSIQKAYSEEVAGRPGSISQVQAVSEHLLHLSKKDMISVIAIGQVVKDGSMAGPKTFEHDVDRVLALEGDERSALRVLRATKDRFGPADQIGLFEMTAKGLIDIENPAELLLTERETPEAGSICTVVFDGARPLVVEVQALVVPCPHEGVSPIRSVSGYDKTRFQTICGVLQSRCKVRVGSSHIYLQVSGGIRIDDPALDLAAALAIASAERNSAPTGKLAAFGEVSLLGEIRRAPQANQRVEEAKRLQFDDVAHAGQFRTLREAIEELLPRGASASDE